MAGDWIKTEKVTPRKPEVLRLAAKLGVHPDHAFGICFRFWCWCDDNLNSCNAVGVTEVMLDALLERDGVASALIDVGWLQVRNGSLVIPNFDRHLSESAKKRGLSANRTASSRSRNRNAPSVTEALPEKRREEKSIKRNIETQKVVRCFSDLFFDGVWDRWRKHRTQKQKPLGDIEEESQLVDLSRYGEAEAIEMVEFSIRCGALNLITNGNHKKQQPTEGPQTSQNRSRFNLKDIPI